MDSRGQITRRTALRQAGALATAVAALEAAGPLAFVPQRALAAATPSDIQFDISAFLSSPPQTFGSGVKFQLPPVHTIFLTAALGLLSFTSSRHMFVQMGLPKSIATQHGLPFAD